MSRLKAAFARHKAYLSDPVFLGVLVLKVAAGATLASAYFLRDRFIPFVSYFVDSGFSDPWTEFLRRGVLDAFPYSSTMLVALALPQALLAPFFGGAAHIPAALLLLLARLPMLAADVAIYLFLCRWFETKRRLVLFLYWCSPVAFYISYVHGQIDAIPTALLMASLWCALRLAPAWAAVFLALGIAAKFHLLIAAPLIAFFLYKSGGGRRGQAALAFCGWLTLLLAALIGPLLLSPGYQVLVLHAKQMDWVYDLAFTTPLGVKVLLCPAALCALVIHFFSFERVTRDILILYLGLIYTILIVLVPPMPGWSYWPVPFLCYFLIRQEQSTYPPFWTYTLAYLAFYLALAPGLALVPMDRLLSAAALVRARDLAFTVMQVSLALVAAWIYRVGLRSYAQYKTLRQPLAVGVGGDSGSGKGTLCATLAELVGAGNLVLLHGDDYHRWPRGHEAWKSMTHLDLRSNYFRQPAEHITELKRGMTIQAPHYDHATGEFTAPRRVEPNHLIVFEGLHPFVFQRMSDVFDVKIFLDVDEGLRRHWKVRRDSRDRGYSAAKVLEEIERRQDDSRRYIKPQAELADWVIQYLPLRPVEAADAAADPGLRARHIVSSKIVEIEDLMDQLHKRSPGLQASWSIEPNLRRQVIEVEGALPAAEVRAIALHLSPDLEDLLGGRPVWEDDLKGVNQLLFLVIYRWLVTR